MFSSKWPKNPTFFSQIQLNYDKENYQNNNAERPGGHQQK